MFFLFITCVLTIYIKSATSGQFLTYNLGQLAVLGGIDTASDFILQEGKRNQARYKLYLNQIAAMTKDNKPMLGIALGPYNSAILSKDKIQKFIIMLNPNGTFSFVSGTLCLGTLLGISPKAEIRNCIIPGFQSQFLFILSNDSDSRDVRLRFSAESIGTKSGRRTNGHTFTDINAERLKNLLATYDEKQFSKENPIESTIREFVKFNLFQ